MEFINGTIDLYARFSPHWNLLSSNYRLLSRSMVFHSILLFTSRPRNPVERLHFFPAMGSLVGAWVGALVIPLDWDRPWQVWPVSCTYGACGGYVLGCMVACLANIVG